MAAFYLTWHLLIFIFFFGILLIRPNAQQWDWIESRHGQRQGIVFVMDMKSRSVEWKLWGNGVGQNALDSLNRLVPPSEIPNLIFAFNGGYWNPDLHAVGICAGENGIHDAISHPSCFAITRDRAWVGGMRSRVSLHPVKDTSPALVEGKLYLNKYPLPQVSPCIIEPNAYPHSLSLFKTARLVEFSMADQKADRLVFNSRTVLVVQREHRMVPYENIDLKSYRGRILLIIPDRDDSESAWGKLDTGSKYTLDLRLDPLKGRVILATSGSPMLLEDGMIHGEIPSSMAEARRSRRTAVGCSADGTRVWVMILVRSRDGLEGLTLRETAELMREQGAWDALNLDGGSSTDLYDPERNPLLSAFFSGDSGIHHCITLNRPPPE